MFPTSGSLEAQNHLLLKHPLWLVAGWTTRSESQAFLHRDGVQADILDRGPDNRQATGLGREDIDLIRPLSHIAEETFNQK